MTVLYKKIDLFDILFQKDILIYNLSNKSVNNTNFIIIIKNFLWPHLLQSLNISYDLRRNASYLTVQITAKQIILNYTISKSQ